MYWASSQGYNCLSWCIDSCSASFNIPFTFDSACSLHRSFGAWPKIAEIQFFFSGPKSERQSEAIDIDGYYYLNRFDNLAWAIRGMD